MRGVMRLENSKYRRMIKRLPDDVKAILESLDGNDWYLEKYSPQYMGWAMDVLVDSKRFNLVKEWHQVFISEINESGMDKFWPKDEETKNYEPKDVANAIRAKIA